MDSDEMLRIVQTESPIHGAGRIHTFRGSFENSTRDVTVEILDWGATDDGSVRFHIRAYDDQGNEVTESNSYADLVTAIQMFPWYEVEALVYDYSDEDAAG